MEFQNNLLDTALLPKSSDVTFQLLDSNYKKVGVYSTLIFALFFLIAYFITGIFVQFLYEFPVILIMCIAWPIITSLLVILSIKGFQYKGFALRQKDILFKSGIFFRSTLIIPFNRIQHSEIEQGPIDRMFGLASISLFTAGGSSSDLNIPGLTMEQATDLKNFISNKVSRDEEE